MTAEVLDPPESSVSRGESCVVVADVVDVVAVAPGRSEVVVGRPVLLQRLQRGLRDGLFVDVA